MLRRFDKGKIPLQWKVFLYLIAFCALLLIILWVMQTVLLDPFYRYIKINETKKLAETVAANISVDDLESFIDQITERSESCVLLTDSTGKKLYSGEASPNCSIARVPSHDLLAYIEAAEDNGGAFMQYLTNTPLQPDKPFPEIDMRFPPDDRPSRALLYIINTVNDQGEELTVFANSNITPVSSTVSTLRFQLLVITGIMIVASITLAWILTRRISRPIENINSNAKELAKGNYDVKFDDNSFLEIRELNQTLNYATKELADNEALQRELLANISHDLRTPLSLIYGYAELMHDFPEKIDSDSTQTIMDETERLTHLVNDILDLSKLRSGVIQLKPETFDLSELIQGVADNLTELLKSDGYTVNFEHETDCIVTADKSKLSQVVYNLLINAVNHTGEDKQVFIHQKIADDSVKIEVSDTGNGISEEDIPHIWERYYKTDKSNRRQALSSGLGLSIVKSIVTLHNGSYGVSSTLGKGSTFWFRIPLKPAE